MPARWWRTLQLSPALSIWGGIESTLDKHILARVTLWKPELSEWQESEAAGLEG